MKYRDLSNKKFGRWSVVSYAGSDILRKTSRWVCVCECGTKKVLKARSLVTGKSKSCGCLHLEVISTKNGRTKNRHYRTWIGILERIDNPDSLSYKHYGGRGIKIHEPWRDFDVFSSDIDRLLGEKPENYSLDRIDNDKGYTPDNVKWSSWSQQAKNRRSVRAIDSYTTEELIRELKKRGVFVGV